MTLTPPTWAELDAALKAALELGAEDRAAYLAALPPALCKQLGPLLDAALADHPILDNPGALVELLAPEDASASVHEGARVGPYRISALVGEGGMGRVYRAHRADGAFEQTVALKVVRTTLALAGSDVAARLRRERVLLAALDHPGIARLIDGGETEDGVPYLVTEFVDGAPITAWAHARGLDVQARVRLIAAVARAVDHAHRRFVVHRDLKPSNVLVTERDGPDGSPEARPVVLDFGIAKLLEEGANAASGGDTYPLTRTGLRVLTPAYAAPELYDASAAVTTSADVYGLGALLYEILTGARPHEDTLASGAPTVEPVRPSRLVPASHPRRASGDGSAPSETSPQALNARTLRGDLDTICLKALHLNPARRYSTAADLADDLDRYLTGRPVKARPDSVAYVFGRFAKRHRAAVGASAVALLALVLGLAFSLVSLANEREAVAVAETARSEAERSAQRATEAANLLAGMFQTASPDYAEGREFTTREALAEGVARVGRVEAPALRAYLNRVLAETYIQIGEPQTADSLLTVSLGLLGSDATGEEASGVRRRLASTRDAMADFESVLSLGQRLYRDHRGEDSEYEFIGLHWISRAYSDLGEHEKAIATAERTLTMLRPGASGARQERAWSRLGEALFLAGRVEESIEPLETSLGVAVAEAGRRNSRATRALMALGRARGHLGQITEAEVLLQEAIAFDTERYGADHVIYPIAYLGEARLYAGQYRRAASTFASAVAVAERRMPADHPDLGEWYALKAEAGLGFGAFAQAERDARAALAIAEAHGDTAAADRARRHLAAATGGRPPEAARRAQQILPARR
ncbi:protein kinase domain-containing protein [Rubricoccus marinus]|uniref:Protein kinase domain-containing protein n=1 Tax=Rubricoccus marinus TaxID=716817 RepID=A0A259TWR9_9BACT|nr:serine/threonine-protein kinase [Rubricoccus marinus]OZC02067.1 hypothetical protein BSZ36_03150 [Rubricoccus marinus]